MMMVILRVVAIVNIEQNGLKHILDSFTLLQITERMIFLCRSMRFIISSDFTIID